MIADAGFRSLVVPLRADHVAAVRPTLLLLEAGALVLLLIGAVNLINLLLIRASGRAKKSPLTKRVAQVGNISSGSRDWTTCSRSPEDYSRLASARAIQLLRGSGADRLPLRSLHRFRRAIQALDRSGRRPSSRLRVRRSFAWFNLRRHLEVRCDRSPWRRHRERAPNSPCVAVSSSRRLPSRFVLLVGAGLLGLIFSE